VSLLATLQLGEWLAVLAVLAAAVPLYAFTRWRRSAPAAAAVGD